MDLAVKNKNKQQKKDVQSVGDSEQRFYSYSYLEYVLSSIDAMSCKY